MQWMIYGANGFAGELIAREAKRRGLGPLAHGITRMLAISNKATVFTLGGPSGGAQMMPKRGGKAEDSVGSGGTKRNVVID